MNVAQVRLWLEEFPSSAKVRAQIQGDVERLIVSTSTQRLLGALTLSPTPADAQPPRTMPGHRYKGD